MILNWFNSGLEVAYEKTFLIIISNKIVEIAAVGRQTTRNPTCFWQNAALDPKRGYLKPEIGMCQDIC